MKDISEILGPPPNDKGQNLDDIQKSGGFALFQKDMHKKYGNIFKAYLVPNQNPVIFIQSMPTKLSHNYGKPGCLYDFLKPVVGNSFHLNDEDTQKVRNLITSFFSGELFKRNFNSLSEIVDDEFNEWNKKFSQITFEIDLQENLKSLAMRMIVFLVFEQKFDSKQGKQLSLAFSNALDAAREKHQLGKSDQDDKLNENMAHVNSLLQELIKKFGNSTAENAFYKKLKKISDEIDGVNEEDLAKFIVMAAHHTIAATVAWVIYAYTCELEDYSRDSLLQEVNSLRLTENNLARSNFTQLKSLISETMRKYTPGPYTARQLDEDTEIHGYLLPKKTTVFFSLWAMHNNPDLFVCPEKFSPDRFADKKKASIYPFGIGKRNCSGQIIANLLVSFLVLKSLKAYEFTPTNTNFRLDINENFVLVSKTGIYVKASQRELAENLNQNWFASKERIFTGISLLSLAAALFCYQAGAYKQAVFFSTISIVTFSLLSGVTNRVLPFFFLQKREPLSEKEQLQSCLKNS